MIIYEVSIEVSNNIVEEYKLWLKDHISEMLKIDGFISAKILIDADCLPDKSNNSLGTTNIIVFYDVESEGKLENYFNNSASAMRQISLDKFGDSLIFKRRVFSVLGNFNV